MTAPTRDDIIRDLRAFVHSCADNLQVPMPAIIEFVASFGGVEQYSDPADAVGHAECREKIRGFCSQYILARLPEEAKVMGKPAEARRRPGGAFSGRYFWSLAEPVLVEFHVLRADWNETVCKALKLDSVIDLWRHPGNEEHAVEILQSYLFEKGKPDMTKEEDLKRKRVQEHVSARWAEWEIDRPTKQGQYWKDCFDGKSMPDIVFSNMSAEDIIAKFDKGMVPRLAALKDLREHGLDADYLKLKGNGNPFANHKPAAAPANGSVSASDSVNPGLASRASDTPPASPTEVLKQAAQKKAKKESAGDAIPFDSPAANEPPTAPQPPVNDASDSHQEGAGVTEEKTDAATPDEANGSSAPGEAVQEQPDSAPPTEPDHLFVKQDFALDETTDYSLEARWSLETGDVWMAKAVAKRSRPDERITPLLVADIETFLKAKRAVDVVLDIEYEPTVPEIDETRKAALALIRDIFDRDTDQQVGEHFEKGTGYKTAAEALRHEDKQAVLDKLHVYLMKAHDEAKAEEERHEANTRALTTTNKIDTVDARPSNIIPFTPSPLKLPSEYEFKMMEVVARNAAKSQLFKDVTTYEKAFMILWRGWELGVNFGTSLEGIWVIEGRPWVGAQVLSAVVVERAKPFRFQTTVNDEGTKATCTVQRREGDPIQTFTFSKEDAQKAGLWENEKKAWKKFPKPMLKRRATRDAILSVFPDIAAGLGLADEDQKEDEAA